MLTTPNICSTRDSLTVRSCYYSFINNRTGTAQQHKFALFSFGIPDVGLNPNDNSLPVKGHLEWIKRRRRLEAKAGGNDTNNNNNNKLMVIVPRRNDVLFGRGKTIATHTGNLRVGHFVDTHRQAYETAGKAEKTRIAEKIVALVKESNGRFLKQGEDDDGGLIP